MASRNQPSGAPKSAATMAEPSAAFDLAQLRHAYAMLLAGSVVDQKQLAEGLLAPAIRRLEAAQARERVLEADVIAFCAPSAVTYARDRGYPPGHLHPAHYDILARCGARMDDFTRADLERVS